MRLCPSVIHSVPWLLLLHRFRVGFAVEYSSRFISVMNLNLYVHCVDALMSRSPSRGLNNLNVYESQHNLGRRLLQRETGLSPPVFYYWPFQGGASVVVHFTYWCHQTYWWRVIIYSFVVFLLRVFYICNESHLINLGRGLLQRKTGLSHQVIYYWPFQGHASVVVSSNSICPSASC